MRLFIIGYMASGKTTFGKALAEKTGLPFIDLDDFIVNTTGKTIPDIFQEKGEEGFREIEKSSLESVIEKYSDAVIACGGGTPCHFDNLDLMNSSGITIFIETSTPVLISRLQQQNLERPLMAGKTDEEISEKVLSQLCERLPDYMRAKLKWHGDDLETASQIEKNVEEFVSSYPSIFR